METILEFFKEALKGIMRVLSAHLFQKTFSDRKKTTHHRRQKQKGGSQKKKYYSIDNHRPKG